MATCDLCGNRIAPDEKLRVEPGLREAVCGTDMYCMQCMMGVLGYYCDDVFLEVASGDYPVTKLAAQLEEARILVDGMLSEWKQGFSPSEEQLRGLAAVLKGDTDGK